MTMHTTTVRFDPETWARLKHSASGLGIATADYIRVAAVQRLERTAYDTRLLDVEERLKLVERFIARIMRRLGLGRSAP